MRHILYILIGIYTSIYYTTVYAIRLPGTDTGTNTPNISTDIADTVSPTGGIWSRLGGLGDILLGYVLFVFFLYLVLRIVRLVYEVVHQ
jgi:hypothetical protein